MELRRKAKVPGMRRRGKGVVKRERERERLLGPSSRGWSGGLEGRKISIE